MNEPENKDPKTDRRQFLAFGLKALGYVAPAIATLAVPALLTEEASAAPPPGMMMMMMHMHHHHHHHHHHHMMMMG